MVSIYRSILEESLPWDEASRSSKRNLRIARETYKTKNSRQEMQKVNEQL
jgi:hypothetical protein